MVAFYYDWTDDKHLSSDDEGNLVVLCAACARQHEADIDLAQSGDGNDTCELCGGSDDEREAV